MKIMVLALEFKSIDIIPRLLKNINADVLVLAGDICAINTKEDYDKFVALLRYYCPKYKYVVHVSGNHEFYTTTKPVTKLDCMDAVHRKFKALNKNFKNYLYLNCDTVTLQINDKAYMFIGCTLWTKVKPKDQEEVESQMNDYNCIFVNKGGNISKLTINDMQKIHMRHRLFIKKSIEQATLLKTPAILVTHHRPLAEATHNDPTDQAYTVDLSDVIKKPIVLSISGHVHHFMDKIINDVRYVTNPSGYPRQRTGFRSDYSITL